MLRVISWLTAALLLPVAAVTAAAPAQAAGPHLITVIAQGSGNVPISGMQVALYYGGNPANPPAANAYSLYETANTGSNGWATFNGMPDGYYKVRYAGTTTYAEHWWDNGTSLADADWFGAGELNPNPTIGPVTMDQRGSATAILRDQYGGALPGTCYLDLAGQSYYLDFLYGRTLDIQGLGPGTYSGPFSCSGGAPKNISFTIGRSSQGDDPSADLGTITYPIPYAYQGGAQIIPPANGYDTMPTGVGGTIGTWDPGPRRFVYYWTVGATEYISAYPTRQITEGDRGKTVTFQACVDYSQRAVCTDTKSLVIPGGTGASVPVNAGPPMITGEPKVGSTLSATTGTWQSPDALTYSYQWRLNGTPNGATGPTYVVPAAAAGKAVSVLVTATTGAGSSSAVSVQSLTVAPGTLALDAAPTLAGVARVGRKLAVKAGRTTPAAPVTYSWFVGPTLVAGAAGPTFKLRKRHLGKRVRVVVRYALPGYAAREVSLTSKKVRAAT